MIPGRLCKGIQALTAEDKKVCYTLELEENKLEENKLEENKLEENKLVVGRLALVLCMQEHMLEDCN
jgi:hypothetical protein